MLKPIGRRHSAQASTNPATTAPVARFSPTTRHSDLSTRLLRQDSTSRLPLGSLRANAVTIQSAVQSQTSPARAPVIPRRPLWSEKAEPNIAATRSQSSSPLRSTPSQKALQTRTGIGLASSVQNSSARGLRRRPSARSSTSSRPNSIDSVRSSVHHQTGLVSRKSAAGQATSQAPCITPTLPYHNPELHCNAHEWGLFGQCHEALMAIDELRQTLLKAMGSIPDQDTVTQGDKPNDAAVVQELRKLTTATSHTLASLLSSLEGLAQPSHGGNDDNKPRCQQSTASQHDEILPSNPPLQSNEGCTDRNYFEFEKEISQLQIEVRKREEAAHSNNCRVAELEMIKVSLELRVAELEAKESMNQQLRDECKQLRGRIAELVASAVHNDIEEEIQQLFVALQRIKDTCLADLLA